MVKANSLDTYQYRGEAMSSTQATALKALPGFWTRLASAIEAASESYTEQLEKRVSWLEAEVERLSAIQQKLPKS